MRTLKLVLAGVFLALATTAAAPRATAPSTPDPYYLNENALTSKGPLPSRDVSGKTPSTQTINTGVQNCILIGAGQSNSPGAIVAPSAFTPVNTSALDFLNPYDGEIYTATDPVIGAAPSTTASIGAPLLRVSDALVTAGKCARVIMMAIAIGGTSIDEWATGFLSNRIGVAIKRLAARGITPQTNVTFVLLWGQGETDGALATTSVAYQASFATMKANAAAAGFSGRWLVARQTFINGSSNATIQGAQAALVNGTDVFAGANGDALVGSACSGASACRIAADGNHWTDAGSISYSTDATNGWVAALHASGLPF